MMGLIDSCSPAAARGIWFQLQTAASASFKEKWRNSRRYIKRSALKQRIVEPPEISLSVSAAADYRISDHLLAQEQNEARSLLPARLGDSGNQARTGQLAEGQAGHLELTNVGALAAGNTAAVR